MSAPSIARAPSIVRALPGPNFTSCSCYFNRSVKLLIQSNQIRTRFFPGLISGSPFLTSRTTCSVTRMGEVSDAAMDAVQRRLMFEDDFKSMDQTSLSTDQICQPNENISHYPVILSEDRSTASFALIHWKTWSPGRCILVDEEDRVIGHDSKYNCHLMEKIDSENLLHRAFSVFLFNSNYELLLQQRSATKVTFPKVWTNTCCSHPLYRHSELIEENSLGVRNAAQRKLFDELGIPAEDLPVDQFIPLGRMLYKAPSDGKWGEHELDYLLFIVRDVTLHPNPDEVADVKYVNRDQLKELLRKADAGEEEIKLSPWFRLVVENFLFKWWGHVAKGTLKEAADMKTIHKLI